MLAVTVTAEPCRQDGKCQSDDSCDKGLAHLLSGVCAP